MWPSRYYLPSPQISLCTGLRSKMRPQQGNKGVTPKYFCFGGKNVLTVKFLPITFCVNTCPMHLTVCTGFSCHKLAGAVGIISSSHYKIPPRQTATLEEGKRATLDLTGMRPLQILQLQIYSFSPISTEQKTLRLHFSIYTNYVLQWHDICNAEYKKPWFTFLISCLPKSGEVLIYTVVNLCQGPTTHNFCRIWVLLSQR